MISGAKKVIYLFKKSFYNATLFPLKVAFGLKKKESKYSCCITC